MNHLAEIEVPTQLPAWAGWIALGLSSILAVIKVVEFASKRIEKARLSLSLTVDGFFRLGADGEVVFLNFIMFPERKPAFITNIEAVLKRMGGSRKEYALELLKLGTPADRGNTIHDHFFFSSSPVDVVTTEDATRRIAMMVIADYRSNLSRVSSSFIASALELGPQIREANAAEMSGDPERAQALKSRILTLVSTFVEQYFEHCQLENSEYEIELTVRYRDVLGAGSQKLRTARSTLRFSLPVETRQVMKRRLEEYAKQTILAAAGSKDVDAQFPEIAFTSATIVARE
jgi:hypothetical protein